MEGSWPDLTPPVLQGQGATNRTPGTEVTSAQGRAGWGGLGQRLCLRISERLKSSVLKLV